MRKLIPTIVGLLLICAAATASHAQTTILFAGGEDTSVTCYDPSNGIHVAGITTSSGLFRSNFAREGIVFDGEPYNRCTANFTGSSSNFWLSFEIYWGNSGNATNLPMVSLVSSDGVNRLWVEENSSANGFTLLSQNAAGTQTQLASESTLNLPENALSRADIYVNYTCSSSGEIQVWVGGIKALDFTGNPCTDSNTSLDAASLYDVGAGVYGPQAVYSEIIAATTSTQAMSLLTLVPNGAGTACNWDIACVYTNANETAINDSSYNATDTSNQIQEFTVPTATPAGTFSVPAICEDLRTEIGASGPQHVAPLVHVGGNDYTLPNLSPTTAFSNLPTNCWSTNPATSNPWSLTDIAGGLQFGAKSEP